MFFNPDTIPHDIPSFDGRGYRLDDQKKGDQNIQVKGTKVLASNGKEYWWITAINYSANALVPKIIIRSWDKEDIRPDIRKELDSYVDNSKNDERSIERRKKALALAKVIYKKSKLLTFYHPYLHSKGLPLLGDERISGKKLILPVIDINDEVKSVQFIAPNGDKRFLSNSETKGHFIGNLEQIKAAKVVGFAEGWATARTASLLFKIPVVSALDAGNLVPVCENILKICRSDTRFVIFADDDSKPWKQFKKDDPRALKNAGIEHGTLALKMFQTAGRVATMLIPVFKNKQEGNSDFNDLYTKEGIEAAKQAYRVVKNGR